MSSLSIAKDTFFLRRSAGLNIKSRDLVLRSTMKGQNVKVAIIYAHGDEVTVFNTHPHIPHWPPPIESLVSSFSTTVDRIFTKI